MQLENILNLSENENKTYQNLCDGTNSTYNDIYSIKTFLWKVEKSLKTSNTNFYLKKLEEDIKTQRKMEEIIKEQKSMVKKIREKSVKLKACSFIRFKKLIISSQNYQEKEGEDTN